MKIIVAHPPNIEQIDAAFHVKDKHGVLYAWEDTIYNPSNVSIPVWLHQHEEVHGIHQFGDVEGWWKKYIEDEEFRYDEELSAHRAELHAQCRLTRDRNKHFQLLMRTANRLVAPMYGFSNKRMKEAMRQLAS